MSTPLRMAGAIGAVVALLAAAAPAGTYYVSPTGSDSASGDAAHPWKTLQYAANRVNAGDTVNVLAGDYTGFDLRRSGTAAAPISFLAQTGVRITADNYRTPDGINVESCSYVVIDGFEVNSRTRAGIRSALSSHVTIRNNRCDSNGKWGIFTGFAEDLLVENNVCSRSGAEHGIYVSNSADRPTVRGNICWGNYGSGIQFNADVTMGGDGIISNALVESNILYDNGRGGGSAINTCGLHDSVIRNNLLYNNHASGITFYLGEAALASRNNLVINNTVHQASDGRWNITLSDAATGNRFFNNILYTEHSFRGVISTDNSSRTGLVSDYNVLQSGNRYSVNDGSSTISLSSWRSTTGQDLHSLTSTPSLLFVSAATGNYRLLRSAVALNAGIATGAPGVDFEGTPRPLGGGYDIGADEYFFYYGDANLDGHVDLADLTILANNYGKPGVWTWLQGDFNNDTALNIADLTMMANNYGSIDESALPAPGVLPLLLAGLGALTRRRRVA